MTEQEEIQSIATGREQGDNISDRTVLIFRDNFIAFLHSDPQGWSFFFSL
ncbi:MAG: hypothetical protein PUC32_03740 [Oscillospiraceae bacterium]|nr:hypothetical protein [Oscillospiraceae bacterium]